MMDTVYIDIETYGECDLAKSGVYKYAEDPAFEILLIAWAVDDGPVRVSGYIPETGIPAELDVLLRDPGVLKVAHNAAFERVCFRRYGYPSFGWRCSEVLSLVAGYPASLAKAAEAMRLPFRKLPEGADLIRYFSIPSKLKDGRKVRHRPEDSPGKWQRFRDYIRLDVEVCRAVWKALPHAHYNGLWDEYYNDQVLNDRGVGVDLKLIGRALEFAALMEAESRSNFAALTGGVNPKSGPQVKAWLGAQGVDTDNLQKKTVDAIIGEVGGYVGQALRERKSLAKASIAKYAAMRLRACRDNRIHGSIQFYGASRTGRYAGRGIQPQNMPRIETEDIAVWREGLMRYGYEVWRALVEEPAPVLSQLVRTAIAAAPGNTFAVADYSAIEARALAWVAGEKWRLDVFNSSGKIYEASAAAMFHVPVETITKDSPLRQKGKVAELALGYGGGPGALVAMGALERGLAEAELPGIVKRWRNASPSIPRLWSSLETAACSAIANPGRVYSVICNVPGIRFRYLPEEGLRMRLPSGRPLSYAKPSLVNDAGRLNIAYFEEDQTSRRWVQKRTYGGKLAENLIQAICRDLLTHALLQLERGGELSPVLHVHDEIVCEAPEQEGAAALERLRGVMCAAPAWAAGLPLRADGFVSRFYKK